VTLAPAVLLATIVLALKLERQLRGSRKAATYLFIGLLMYAIGAIVLEAAFDFSSKTVFSLYGQSAKILEDFLEMSGILLIFKGFLEHGKFLAKR
jgi:hypothetical protein